MANYKLVIQYDGARYKGWQRLGDGELSIQGKIETVLSELAGRHTEIIGSSRTDAGVHALAQVANFKTDEKLTAAEIRKYLNRYLPDDISIIEVSGAAELFHARYNAKDKTYLYKIWNMPHPNPFLRKYSMHVEKKMNLVKMRQATRFFVGEHDFTAFSNAKSQKKSKVRTLHSIEIEEEGGLVQIRICGDGFLHNMVRKIVGTLVEVGLGEVDAEKTIPGALLSMERNKTGALADACGLYLEKVDF